MLYKFLFACFLFTACNSAPSSLLTIQDAIKTDSLSALNEAGRFASQAAKITDSYKISIRTHISDTVAADTITADFKKIETLYGDELNKKTNQLISNRRYFWEIQYAQPNKYKWPLIIGIIFICGILGGLAAPRYSLLNDLLEQTVTAAKDLSVKTETIKNLVPGIEGNLNNQVNELNNAQTELQQKVDALKQQLNRTPDKATGFDYIIFGILSAGIVPVFLLASNSKTLDFKTDIDYLLFAGFCLTGALFAKSSIKGAVERLKKS